MLDASIRLPMMQKHFSSQSSAIFGNVSIMTDNFMSASYRELPK